MVEFKDSDSLVEDSRKRSSQIIPGGVIQARNKVGCFLCPRLTGKAGLCYSANRRDRVNSLQPLIQLGINLREIFMKAWCSAASLRVSRLRLQLRLQAFFDLIRALNEAIISVHISCTRVHKIVRDGERP